MENFKKSLRALKSELAALYLAYRDPRTPWYARVAAILVIAYALSPIDLIPDFIPVLGYLDDLVILPLGIFIAIKLIPCGDHGFCPGESSFFWIRHCPQGLRGGSS